MNSNNGKLELGGGIGGGENYEPITTDSLEVKELKNKLKIIMNKVIILIKFKA